MPSIHDEYNLTVAVSVEFDKSMLLSYDPVNNVLNLTKTLEFDQNFEVKFTLKNTLGLAKTYKMNINFFCTTVNTL